MPKKVRGDEAEYTPGSRTSHPDDVEPSLFAQETREYLKEAQARVDALPKPWTARDSQASVEDIVGPIAPETLRQIHSDAMAGQIQRLSTAPHDLQRAYPRNSDPDTSARAADRASLRMNENRRAVIQCFQDFGRMTDPTLCESYEMARREQGWPQQSDSGIRSRRAELVKMGKIKKVGETETHSIWSLV